MDNSEIRQFRGSSLDFVAPRDILQFYMYKSYRKLTKRAVRGCWVELQRVTWLYIFWSNFLNNANTNQFTTKKLKKQPAAGEKLYKSTNEYFYYCIKLVHFAHFALSFLTFLNLPTTTGQIPLNAVFTRR